jgi:hypothetical protein
VPEVALVSLRRAITSLLTVVLLGGGVGTAAAVALPTAAFADSSYSMEAQFIAKMNAARQANGLRPYSVASDLTSVARAHSANMASKQSLYHNPSLTSEVHNWQAVGENVGEGPTVDDIHNAFMQSPEHRANILDHDYTQVGVGVSVDKHGIIWVTEDFRQPMGSTTSTAPAPSHHSSGSASSSSSSSTYQPASSSAPSTGTTSAPRPTLSPRAVLRARVQQLRHAHAPVASDPVAQSFDYVAALAQLSS